jgi:hypothetical protein
MANLCLFCRDQICPTISYPDKFPQFQSSIHNIEETSSWLDQILLPLSNPDRLRQFLSSLPQGRESSSRLDQIHLAASDLQDELRQPQSSLSSDDAEDASGLNQILSKIFDPARFAQSPQSQNPLNRYAGVARVQSRELLSWAAAGCPLAKLLADQCQAQLGEVRLSGLRTCFPV